MITCYWYNDFVKFAQTVIAKALLERMFTTEYEALFPWKPRKKELRMFNNRPAMINPDIDKWTKSAIFKLLEQWKDLASNWCLTHVLDSSSAMSQAKFLHAILVHMTSIAVTLYYAKFGPDQLWKERKSWRGGSRRDKPRFTYRPDLDGFSASYGSRPFLFRPHLLIFQDHCIALTARGVSLRAIGTH